MPVALLSPTKPPNSPQLGKKMISTDVESNGPEKSVENTPSSGHISARQMLYAKAILKFLSRALALVGILVPLLNAWAHTTSVTSIDARLTTTNFFLTLHLQQPDLLQIAREGPKDKFNYANQEDFRTNAAWIAEYVSNRVSLAFDGVATNASLSNWPPAKPELTIEIRDGEEQPAPLEFHLQWPIPPAAKEMKLVFSLYETPGFSALFQILFDLGPEAMPVMHVVPSGRETVIDLVAFTEDMADEPPAAPIPPPATNQMVTNIATTNATTTNLTTNNFATTNSSGAEATKAPPAAPAKRPVRFNPVQFISIGFEHILPKGLDHILFVLALFFLSTHWRPLLWQVTAFTVAHSITLALAMNGVIDVSPKIVEPIIALSIAAVALENLFSDKVSKWRWIGVFAFGLIHGLGFAGVLGEMQIPEGHFGLSLLCFNVGVELGQLAVIAIAWIVVVGKAEQPWYPRYVRNPACYLLAAIGLYWTIERIFF